MLVAPGARSMSLGSSVAILVVFGELYNGGVCDSWIPLSENPRRIIGQQPHIFRALSLKRRLQKLLIGRHCQRIAAFVFDVAAMASHMRETNAMSGNQFVEASP
jgi:hypothetical protein